MKTWRYLCITIIYPGLQINGRAVCLAFRDAINAIKAARGIKNNPSRPFFLAVLLVSYSDLPIPPGCLRCIVSRKRPVSENSANTHAFNFDLRL